MTFVDTNYFVRFFLKDVQKQYKEAEKLFISGSKKKDALITSTIVFFEIYWLFVSFYGKTKAEIIEILQKFMGMNFIVLEERELLAKTLDIYAQVDIDLEDCYYLAFMKARAVPSIKTFDEKLQKAFAKLDAKL